MKKQTKENFLTFLFVIIVGLLVAFYVVYPLNRTKALIGRPNLDDFKSQKDSTIANSDSVWRAAEIEPDTFRVETDGLTTLACLRCLPKDSAIGTVIILHNDGESRDSVLPLALAFLSSRFAVVAYDQRASGKSTDYYRGGGWFEGNDLTEVIAYLDLRNQLIHPVSVVGFGLGGDAAIISSQNEKRIDAVVAMNPYLTSSRWLQLLKEKNGMLTYPFWKTVMWWYYGLRSSYAAPYREIDDIKSVLVPTLLFIEKTQLQTPEILKLKEISSEAFLTVYPTPFDESGKIDRILEFIKSQK